MVVFRLRGVALHFSVIGTSRNEISILVGRLDLKYNLASQEGERYMRLEGRVLITGGAGFLGRGIMRRANYEAWPCEFIIYSRDEHNQSLCKEKYPDAHYILGDVTDLDHVTRVIEKEQPRTVIHAAALKFIPEGEVNALEVTRINIEGSLNIATACIRLEVPLCIAISTDKAVQPVNIYGASKMIVERCFAELAQHSFTRFQTVRYGNVVGSTGSVIPIMQRTIKETGHVKVTNPRMTRFWMPVDAAVDCILFAAQEERIPGSVTVPRPQAMSMKDLAFSLLAQYHTAYPVEGLGSFIDIIGTRLGEKEHEHLISYQEQGRVKIHSDYYEVLPSGSDLDFKNSDALETVSSQYPPAGFVKPEQIQQWIADATHV